MLRSAVVRESGFRRRFGVTPHAFRSEGRLPTAAEQDLPQRVDAATPVSLLSTVVRTLQPMSLACIRHTGPYEHVPINLWDTLIDWARRHDIPAPYVLLGIAHDAPGITAPGNLRFDAAVCVPGEFRSSPATVAHVEGVALVPGAKLRLQAR